jgi:spermidine synthase
LTNIKLYSVQFFRLVKRHLAASGIYVTQSSSPFFSRDAFWCIAKTLEAADFHIAPYHTYVPSFGDWGFILAASHAIRREGLSLSVPTKYLTPEMLREMFVFSKDSAEVPVDISTLDHPRILVYYLNDTKQWE